MALANVNIAESSAELLQGDSSDDVISPKRKLNVDAHTHSPRVEESTYSGSSKRFVSVLSKPVNNKQPTFDHSNFGQVGNADLSEDHKELFRFCQVGRRKDFAYYENIDGKKVNVLKGLELYTNVFNPDEQKEIVELVYKLQRMGRNRELRGNFSSNFVFSSIMFISIIISTKHEECLERYYSTIVSNPNMYLLCGSTLKNKYCSTRL